MSNQSSPDQPPNVDPTIVGCRVIDVQSALQNAFSQFTSSPNSEGTLEELALLIQEHLANVPAFLINVTTNQPDSPQG